MSYTKEGLKSMAETLLAAKATGDTRYVEFVMTVAIKANSSSEVVEQMITGETQNLLQKNLTVTRNYTTLSLVPRE